LQLFIKSSIFSSSPSLCELKLGTPLRIIRFWENEDGRRWIQVEKSNINLIEINPSSANRGWVNA